jgi:DNA-binding HxlR family transcriptional regulator
MLTGKKRFGEFLQSPERITTNILSDRLVRLEHAGIVERRPRGPTSRRYDYLLTDKGEALLPVLQEICRWANAHLPDTWVPPESFMAARPAKGEPRR